MLPYCILWLDFLNMKFWKLNSIQNLVSIQQYFGELIFLYPLLFMFGYGSVVNWMWSVCVKELVMLCPFGYVAVSGDILLVTTGWEWGIGIECVEVRDAARYPTVLSHSPPPQRIIWLKMSVVLRLSDPGAVDDFISCKRYCELTPSVAFYMHLRCKDGLSEVV